MMTSVDSFSHLLATAFFKMNSSLKHLVWGISWHFLCLRTNTPLSVWLREKRYKNLEELQEDSEEIKETGGFLSSEP